MYHCKSNLKHELDLFDKKQTGIWQFQKFVIRRQGFGFRNVETSSEDFLLAEGSDQRVRINHCAAADVHEDRGILHFPELVIVEEPPSLVVQRHSNDDEIALGQQFVEGNENCAEFLLLSIVPGVEESANIKAA